MPKRTPQPPEPASQTVKVNVRVTKKMREAIAAQCEREEIGVNDMVRYLVEAGLMVAEKRGLPGVMAERSEFLAGEYPPPPTKSGRKPKKKITEMIGSKDQRYEK